MQTLTGTITEVEVRRFTPFVPNYYKPMFAEEYDVRLMVTLQTDDGAIVRFRSPAVSHRITTVPGVAVCTVEENDWIKGVKVVGDHVCGETPASKLNVGQRLTIRHRVNERGFLNYVKIMEVS